MKNEKEEKEEKNRKKWLLLLLLLLLLLISIGVSVWALFFRNSPVLPPDYAGIDTERHAEPIGDDDSKKLDAPEGGGAVSLTFSKEVRISLSDKKATLMFANPGKSTQDMVIQVVVKDVVIIQSGRILPGNRVTTLDLLKNAAKQLSPGGYDGKFVLSFYDRESGEKAMINTEIPITVTVTN